MGAGKQGWRSVARRWAGARFVTVTVLLGVASGALCGSAGAAAPVRESPAGALDPGFASGGVLSASFGTTAGPQEGRDAVIQPDGKIIVLTTSASADYLSRYLPNGEPDTTFGSGGTVTHPLNQNSFSALTLDAEGRIVVIGEESAPPWQDPDKTLEVPDRAYGVVYRFLPDGSPDSNFGMNGKTVIAVPPPESLTPGSASTYPSAVPTASDGGITVGGAVSSICFWEVGEIRRWWEESGTFVARLKADGSLESQFASSGLVSTHGRCQREAGAALESFGGLVQSSPESVMALVGHTEDNTWRFRTYSPTGALSEVQAPAEGESPTQIVMIGDHYLVLSVHYTGGTEALRRFTAQGVPDPTFGTTGRIAVPMACEFGPRCFAVLSDGRILIAGRLVYGQIGVRRYLADGSPDYSFGGGGAWAELPGGNELDTVNRLLVLHGQPLVVGAEQVPGTGYADNQMALTLFQADGGLSPSPPQPEPGEGSDGSDGGGSGPSLGSGNSGGSIGATYGPAQSDGSPAGAATNAVDAALNTMLSPHGRAPTISSLLKTGGYSLNFDAPGPGTLSVQWMSTSTLTSHHTKGKTKPILVASGAETFRAAGHGTVKLYLTVAGRKLLRVSRTLRLGTSMTFRPVGANAVVRHLAITIVRGVVSRAHRSS
jgi:uncharacterized delta-60 repeat protein